MKPLCFFCALCATGLALGAEITPLYKLSAPELEARLAADAQTARVHRDGLRAVVAYMNAHPELFPEKQVADSRLLRREDKQAVWAAWQRFLDYMLALDSLEQFHAQFSRLKGTAKEDSFLIGYTSMVGRYRAALEFISRAENNPELDKVLNDAVPELGLPAGTYAKLKYKYLNVAIATQFAGQEVLLKTFTGHRQPALRAAIHEDADYVWTMGKGKGHELTAKNALKVVQNGAQTGWLPVQRGVSEWMGHTKVYRANQALISPAQVAELQPKLQPGDVLLERREWYLSNIGLPGFWSHAALYIGTADERRAFFDEPGTRQWVTQRGETSGDLEPLLHSTWATRTAGGSAATSEVPAYLVPQEDGSPVRIVEAIGEGVSFKTLEHSAACDSIVVLRPRLPKVEKALALVRAFHYAGRPYDYNFDFSTDAELVCTELVYKSYEPGTGFKGLTFPLVEMLGRKVTPANELAKQFDEQYGTAGQQFDVVSFLDGQERQKKAVESTVDAFRQTWKRPKWHVLVQP